MGGGWVEPPARTRPRIGAIRWDAWQEDGWVQEAVEGTLRPHEFRHRLPFFAQVQTDDSVRIDGNRPEVMDAEIGHAVVAGVDYWAFVTYPPSNGMSNGLELYLASDRKSDVGFCLVLQGGWLDADPFDWSTQVDRYAELFRDPDYVTVLDQRPLVYLFDLESMFPSARFPTLADARAAFATLAEASADHGLGAPYYVLLGWSPDGDADLVEALGLDALGAYAAGAGTTTGAPFADGADAARMGWLARHATGRSVVPLVTAGWDPRPRCVTPEPWCDFYDPLVYYDAPTALELASHLFDGLRWVREQPWVSPANVVIVYAWNEHDEGGWLCPTLGGSGAADTSRVEAVRNGIELYEQAVPVANFSFEHPAASDAWFVVPADDMPEWGWAAETEVGTYLLATANAAHFDAAADGLQALLLSNVGSIEQPLGAVRGSSSYSVSVSLLTGQYPGDEGGVASTELLIDDHVLASTSCSTPAEPGVWASCVLTTQTDAAAQGQLRLRLTATSAMVWIDAVDVSRTP